MESHICYNCIGEKYLQEDVKKRGKRKKCMYCSSIRKGIPIEKLAEKIELAFEQHYEQSSEKPALWREAMQRASELNDTFESEGDLVEKAIMIAAEIPHEAAQLIQSILYNKHYNADFAEIGKALPYYKESYYHEKKVNSEEIEKEWNKFELIIKTQVRFFSPDASTFLNNLFQGISSLKTKRGSPVIKAAGPNHHISSLFRARVFQKENKLQKALTRPDKELSAPPPAFASSGRMNAKGIPVFYGAIDRNTAIAEVRPPVKSLVAVAEFEIIRPIMLLDIMALTDIYEEGSIFDSTYAERLRKAHFFKSFCRRMSAPVMPEDAGSDYLVTQCIADYLATSCEVVLDGIIYPSYQTSSRKENIILFNKASKLKQLPELENGAIAGHVFIQEDSENEIVNDYIYIVLREYTPRKDNNSDKAANESYMEERKIAEDQSTLHLIIESITIHRIQSVLYDAPNLTLEITTSSNTTIFEEAGVEF